MRAKASSPGDSTLDYLVRILCVLSRPRDILVMYLRRPVPGFLLREGMRTIALGNFPRKQWPVGITDRDILSRAEATYRWLSGDSLGGIDPFKVLGLSYAATEQQIVHRFRTLSKRVHPDLHPESKKDYWTTRQHEINEAYRILSDPQAKTQWRQEFEERRQLLNCLWRIERTDHR